MVRNGANAQATLAVTSGIHIQGGGFHFQSHDAHLLQTVHAVQALGYVFVVTVEHIRRIHIAHMIGCAVGLTSLHRFAEQFPRSNGCKCTGHVELILPCRIGACALGDHDVIQVNMILDRAGRAHTDDVFHTEEIKQLMGIDADGRHTHAGSHNGHLNTLVIAGVAVDTTNVVHQHGIFQKVFSNKLRTQGITGHQHSFAKADLILHIDMRGRRKVSHS